MTKNTFKTNSKINIGLIALVVISPVFFIHFPASSQPSLLPLDKIFHYLFYFLFGLWFLWSKLKARNVFLLLFFFGLLIEGLQKLTGYRSCEFLDVMANTMGILSALMIYKLKSHLN